jgi:phosphinothricin acetyltransferase
MTHPPAPLIRPATAADADAIARIYNHYITRTVISFEEEPLSAAEVAARMAGVRGLGLPWLVVEAAAPGEGGRGAGQVVGYAYANRWRARSAYQFVAESTIYLAYDAAGRGLGRALYSALIAAVRAETALRALIACIALPNPASVGLHEALGFRHVGTHPAVGFKQGQWVDVGDWILSLHPAA